MKWNVKDEHDQWRFGEYWLTWDEATQVLTFKGEGQDTPKDQWGFEYTYPPRKVDEHAMDHITKVFGAEVAKKIIELTGYTSSVA